MMKDVDEYFRHLNTLIYKYFTTTYSMHHHDVIARFHAYNYDVFHNYTNLRIVIAPTTPLVTTSFITPVHTILRHSSLPFFKSPPIFYMSTRPLRTELIFITLETITWLSFESIVSSFGSLLHS